MALRFVFGRAGSGKSRLCLEEICALVGEKPSGAPLILLVPEQASYQMEVQLASRLGGMMRAQVLSFKRLAWRVLSEVGGGQRPLLGEIGKRMLLRRVLLAQRSELKALARSAARQGMADTLARMLGEFKAYRLGPQDLRQVAEKASPRLKSKLSDIALIYEKFEESIQGVTDPDDELSVASERLAQAQTGPGALIWVDGFKGFTPQELRVLAELMKSSLELTITLPLDPVLWERAVCGEEPLLSQHDMFATVWETALALQRLAGERAVSMAEPVLLMEGHRFQEARLAHLERWYGVYPGTPFLAEDWPGQEQTELGGIHLVAAVHRRAEVEGVAREIRRLAREKGLRWRDMLVLTRDLGTYAGLLKEVFTLHDIPLFLDYKRKVMHHPLLEFMSSVLEIARSDWAFEPVFRCLKTGFFPLPRDTVDRLENYCLAHGIHGEAWTREAPWTFYRTWTLSENEAEDSFLLEMDRARRVVAQCLTGFTQRVREQERVLVRELAEGLYTLVQDMDIPGQLQGRAEAAERRGEMDEALLQQQVWQGVSAVFGEMVAGLGDTELSLEDVSQVLASGMESMELGIIPPTLDQVLAGSLDRSRNPEVKVTFLLGANDGVLPARPAYNGILDLADREELEGQGLQLSPGLAGQMRDEQFFIYSALTRASQALYLTYALTDPEGKGMTSSQVLKRIKTLFPGLEEQLWRGSLETVDDLSHPHALWLDYALQLNPPNLPQHLGFEALTPFWQAVREWLQKRPEYADILAFLERQLRPGEREGKLPSSLARSLYGRRLQVSVSRLEEFKRCPFGHYARYGLRLRERSRYALASPDLGRFFHRLLYRFAQTVRERGLSWGALSREQSWDMLGEITDQIAPELQSEILLSSARYRYLARILKRTVHQAVRVLGEQARRGRFIPLSLELRFGDQGLRTPEIELADGTLLALSGQIDRIDAFVAEGIAYFRIMDYKSHPQILSLDKVYYGLNLQLLAYLDVALQGADALLAEAAEPLGIEGEKHYEVKPAGFIYFPVVYPFVEGKTWLEPEEIEHERLKAMRVDGYLLADVNILQTMDEALSNGQSDLFGLRLNKDGGLRQGAKVLELEQFELLRQHFRQVLKETGSEILAGAIGIEPFKLGKTSGCDYCAFGSVCHFQADKTAGGYRVLSALKPETVWSFLQTSVGQTASELGSAQGYHEALVEPHGEPVDKMPAKGERVAGGEVKWLEKQTGGEVKWLQTKPDG